MNEFTKFIEHELSVQQLMEVKSKNKGAKNIVISLEEVPVEWKHNKGPWKIQNIYIKRYRWTGL